MELAPITEVSYSKERPSEISSFFLSKPKRFTNKATTRITQHTVSDDNWTKLHELKELLNSGFITKDDYNVRTKQIIDQMTGTKGREPLSPKREYIVVPSVPPNFDDLPSEKAIKYVFETNGTDGQKQWISYPIRVKIGQYPFSKGGLRYVYHMMEYPDQFGCSIAYHQSYVCKIAIDPDEDVTTYFRDVEMQELCRVYADKFNKYNPPRKVTFPRAWIVELIEKGEKHFCHVEVFLKGTYKKHNNNYGFVSEDYRNTPQAFSHFTYEASNKELVVVDIQGVLDIYTDPQVHSKDDTMFGKGNLGEIGIKRFTQTHRCNAICKYLKLPQINPFEFDAGTLPASKFMTEAHIDIMRVGNLHVYDTDPLVQKLLKKNEEKNLIEHQKCNLCQPCLII